MSKSLVKIRPVLGAVHAPGWLRAPIMQSTIASVSSAPLYVQHWGLTAATRSPRVATSTACGSKAAAAPTMVHAPTAFFLPALRGARAAWAAKTARTLRAQHTKIVRSGLAPARELASAAPQSDPRAAACGELIDVEPIALQFRERIRSKFQQLAALGIERPSLVALLASDDEAALSYAEWTAKAFGSDGAHFHVRRTTRARVYRDLLAAREDTTVHGVLIYYPCWRKKGGENHPEDSFLRNCVPIEKDVEGLSDAYRQLMYEDVRTLEPHCDAPAGVRAERKCLLPCTPLAVVKVLEYLLSGREPCISEWEEGLSCHEPRALAREERSGFQKDSLRRYLRGRTVVVFNRSEVVGRPLACMLSNDGGTVYSVDLEGTHLLRGNNIFEKVDLSAQEVLREASIVITGVPDEDWRLPIEWVQPGSIVINISMCENVDEEAILRVPGVRYVPQLGKVTVAMLQRNLLRLIFNFHLPGFPNSRVDPDAAKPSRPLSRRSEASQRGPCNSKA